MGQKENSGEGDLTGKLVFERLWHVFRERINPWNTGEGETNRHKELCVELPQLIRRP